MPYLLIRCEVADSIDPTLVDPHDVAEDIIENYNEWGRSNGQPEVDFESAEWETKA